MSDNRSNPEDTRAMMQEAEGLYKDACSIIEQAQAVAYRAVNEVLIKRNWLLGMRIQLEVLKDKRAEYGERIIKELASALTAQYGKGFTWRNLYNYIDFYQKHEVLFQVKTVSDSDSTEILHAVSAKSGGESAQSIMHAMSAKLDKETGNNFHAASGKSEIVPSQTGIFNEVDLYTHLLPLKLLRLSWTHYRIILQELTIAC